jgi:hypothetical protein
MSISLSHLPTITGSRSSDEHVDRIYVPIILGELSFDLKRVSSGGIAHPTKATSAST